MYRTSEVSRESAGIEVHTLDTSIAYYTQYRQDNPYTVLYKPWISTVHNYA